MKMERETGTCFFRPSLCLFSTLKLITSSLSILEFVHPPFKRTGCLNPSPRATILTGEGQRQRDTLLLR